MESEKNSRGFGSGQEKRRFIRLNLDPPIKVKFRFFSSDFSFGISHEKEALIKNISVGGGLIIELVLKSKAEQDNLLNGKVKIRFETGIPGVNPQIKISGKVVWTKKIDKSDLLYEAGVSFENLDEKTKENIMHAMIDLAFKQKNLKIDRYGY